MTAMPRRSAAHDGRRPRHRPGAGCVADGRVSRKSWLLTSGRSGPGTRRCSHRGLNRRAAAAVILPSSV